MQVRRQQLELDMEQQTGPKLGKEYINRILLPCLFNLYADYIIWNARLDEAQAGIKTWYIKDIDGRKLRRTKEPLDESERGEWKSWLKTQHSEN